MTQDSQEVVHIFSVRVPGDKHTSYVWRPIQSGYETLTDEEILEAEKEVLEILDSKIPGNAIVKYFAVAGKTSIVGQRISKIT
jgi:hypothetical protein